MVWPAHRNTRVKCKLHSYRDIEFKCLNTPQRLIERCMNTIQSSTGGNLALTTELYLKTLLKVMLGLLFASA